MQSRARIPVGPPIPNPLPSYWQDPKSPLANLIEPAADASISAYDYAIIGSGITGAMIAHKLLRRRPSSRVVLLEARSLCSGATGRNGGHTKAASYRSYLRNRAELGRDEAVRIARLEWSNIVKTHGLARELGIDEECESVVCRTVDVVYDRGAWEEGVRAIEVLRGDVSEEERGEGGMGWYVVHEASDETLRKFHVAATNGKGENVVGVFEYMAGRIHAYRFTTGVLKACVKLGLHILTNTPVQRISPSSSPSSSSESANQKWTLHTPHAPLSSTHILLATNAYTPSLLPSFQSAIVPMRGQITAQRPGPESTLPVPLPTTYSFVYKGGYEYMIARPLKDGKGRGDGWEDDGQHVIIGGGLGRLDDEVGASQYGIVDDAEINTDISEYLQNSLTGYFGASNFPASTSDRIVAEWSGIMAATNDGRPFVGEVPGMAGVWVCAGFNGHGMVLAERCAEGVVGMVVGEEGWEKGKGEMKEGEWWPRSLGVSGERSGREFLGRRDLGGEGGVRGE